MTSMSLLEELWNGEPVRLLGVRATKLVEEDAPIQLNLFSYTTELQKNEKEKKIDTALDEIRHKYGKQAVMRGTLFKKD